MLAANAGFIRKDETLSSSEIRDVERLASGVQLAEIRELAINMCSYLDNARGTGDDDYRTPTI